MIYSMTGFGRATLDSNDVQATVEIKALNSKQFDVQIRTSGWFSEKEMHLRNWLGKEIQRGKVILHLNVTPKSTLYSRQLINENLFKSYHKQLSQLKTELGENEGSIMELVMNMPDVLVKDQESGGNEDLWKQIEKCVSDAIAQFNDFRLQEGKATQTALIEYLDQIEAELKVIEEADGKRIPQIRSRIKSHLDEYLNSEDFDPARLEQEMIFYIEKLDISEERVRLKNHLKYFREIMSSNETAVGKKLGFLSQELGREINTIGSKSNDLTMQQCVVRMKDELEKIKEQTLNIL
jgi:uncharacterized protein (TIGR00255 family)